VRSVLAPREVRALSRTKGPIRPSRTARWGASALLLLAGCGRDAIDLIVPAQGTLGADAAMAGDALSAPDSASTQDQGNVGVVETCSSDSECTGSSGVCAREQGRCVECTEHFHCPQFAPYCNVAKNQCVLCLDSSSCQQGAACDPVLFGCLPACRSEADCFDPVPICDEGRGTCIQCQTDQHCEELQFVTGVAGTTCYDGICGECATDADCPSTSEPRCQRTFRCVECVEPRDCDPGFQCDFRRGRCYSTG
jgi:hypothetical protein